MELTKENIIKDLEQKLEEHPEVYENIAVSDLIKRIFSI